MKNKNYFLRVNEQTPTRFWINNVTKEEAYLAIQNGAIGCTQNPSYVWKMLSDVNEKEEVIGLIRKYQKDELDDSEVLVKVQRELVANIAKIFLPLYEKSNGTQGFVSIQGDPFKEDTDTIIKNALYNREGGQNIMAKIPVTKDGLKAIEYLSAKRVPINATEVMAVKQALDVCEIYTDTTKELKDRAPIYFSHITGIYDEYLAKVVKNENIDVSPDAVWQAGMIIAKKIYWMVKDKKYEVGFIGGGARGLHHFTEMVGADANITINWKGTADKLIESNPPVIQRFLMPVSESIIDELTEKIVDFKRGYYVNAITAEEYEHFGPVVQFRNSFEDAWTKSLDFIASLR